MPRSCDDGVKYPCVKPTYCKSGFYRFCVPVFYTEPWVATLVFQIRIICLGFFFFFFFYKSNTVLFFSSNYSWLTWKHLHMRRWSIHDLVTSHHYLILAILRGYWLSTMAATCNSRGVMIRLHIDSHAIHVSLCVSRYLIWDIFAWITIFQMALLKRLCLICRTV